MDSRKLEYSQKLRSGEAVSYKFVTYSHSIRDLTLSLVSQFLGEFHLNHIRSSIFTFLTEIINNAVKANLKRIYFKNNSINMEDPEAYRKAVATFNEDAVSDIEHYAADMKAANLITQISLQQKPDGLVIAITNNTGIHEQELKKIQDRISIARQFNTMEEAMLHFIDTSEGGGLGIILTVLLLKKAGIDPDNFRIESSGDITRSLLRIPVSAAETDERLRRIEAEVMSNMEMLPTFPDTVQRVLELCDNKDSHMGQIAATIEKDPALTADILKIVNSAAFSKHQKVKTLTNALPILGVKAIKQITLASASLSILKDNYPVFKEFWDHAARCGNYARRLTEILNLPVEKETAYLGGLLHDLGKIILYSVNPEIMKEIQNLNIDKTRMNSATLEEINMGVSHAQVGANIAEKWGFSAELVEVIRNHHRPFLSHEGNGILTAAVHIANALINIESKKGSYTYIDSESTMKLGIATQERLHEIHDQLLAEFPAH